MFLATPAAVAGLRLPPDPSAWTMVWTDPADHDALDRLRAAAAVQPIRATVVSSDPVPFLTPDQRTYTAVRAGLLIGALFTLALSGISLLVPALDQMRERRRPLAVLAAAGVPRAMPARSLLWQTALPVVVGVAAAVGTGIALAALVLRLSGTGWAVDWSAIGILCGGAAALVLLVTIATLPSLRRATRLTDLRTE